MAVAGVIVDNDSMATGMEKKEIDGTADIFWSREPIMGHKGTRENPAIVPSFNTSRVVGLETEQVRPPPPAALRRPAARASSAARSVAHPRSQVVPERAPAGSPGVLTRWCRAARVADLALW